MDSSPPMMGKPKGLLQRRAALIAWVTVLTVAAVLDAVWLISDERASPNYPLVVGVGLLGGGVLGVVLAYVWDRHAGRLKRASDVEAATGLPVLAEVPAMRREGADRVAIAAGRPAYSRMAAELADALGEAGANSLLITSPTRGSGRTTTAVILATLVAAEGRQVALLSADPTGEGVDEVLGLERRPGLTEVSNGWSSLEEALQPGGIEGLTVLTAGGPSDEVLSQRLDKLARVLARLSKRVDLIVIDGPPVLGSLEGVLLAQDIDWVLVVVDVRHGKRFEASLAVTYLGHVQDRLVGCVANDPGRLRHRRTRGAPVAAPNAARAALGGLAAAVTGVGLRLRRGAGAVAGAVGTAVSSTRGTARAARGRLTSAASLRALRRHPWTGVIASVLAVAVVISTVWWLSYDDGVKAQDGSEAPSGQTAVGVAVEECTSTWHAQAAPLEAAAKALEQWQVHVDAMNQLVAGEITLDQANAFWERTRMQAAHKVHRFHTADGTYTAGEHSCRTPDVARNADAGLAALTACRHNIAQRDDTLRAARFAIDTWHHHVTDMDRVRAGTMSPARAVQLWIKYWKQGAAELDDYRSQLRQTDDQNC